MKNFGLRRFLDRLANAAVSSIKGFSSARTSVKFLIGIIAVIAPICLFVLVSNLRATPPTVITVDVNTDGSSTGVCTLRAAIDSANSHTAADGSNCTPGTGNDVIQFSISSATITVGSTLPAIANSGSETLTIDGTTQNITVDGATTFQVMSVNAGATLALNNLTVAHGLAAADGGGVLNNGALTVASCNFSNNSADSGGAISSSSTGTLSITQSTFSGNSATSFGGALLLHNGASISNSTFSANNETTSGFDQGGGAIWTDGGGTNVTGSTFSANTAAGNGGGIYADNNLSSTDTTLNVLNSTFSNNSASNSGAVLTGFGSAVAMITNSTFSGNFTGGSPGGSVGNASSGLFIVSNSILAGGNGGHGNCGGAPIMDGGYNISDDESGADQLCGFTGVGANGQTLGDGVVANLDPDGLENNGGPTQTIALGFPSPAIDAIPIGLCPLTDQRGFTRADPGDNGNPNPACDIGAFEASPIIVNTLANNVNTPGDGECSLREAINNAKDPDTTAAAETARLTEN